MAIVASDLSSVRATVSQPQTWQGAMKSAIRDPAELCRELDLPAQIASRFSAESFRVFAPRGYVAKMVPGDPSDPLLLQVLPRSEETRQENGFVKDAVGDLDASLAPGLIHKYEGRVLLVATGACAIHCRYCFRRHFPYEATPRSLEAWRPAIERIASDNSVEEVILSGGDPLTLVDGLLEQLVCELERIPHLKRLRVHTRLPVVIPERVTSELLALLAGSRLTPIVVIHANHARELEGDVSIAVAKLIQAGVPVLNQAVLLRGVNDAVDSLTELSRALVNLRVMPYYLHQLDRVAGAGHFEVSVERGIELIEQLRARLPGYAVPRYVQEIAGESSKRVLA
ncbi:MAG: EF-P beta-lysylation protein EpmB [Planctomycetaceae bacterium]|nr:EF-P beta-lysylation protein EpmB [Planctomycetales bacterium]MCB9874115.1 EF-P beta-lysylation protein EpmB [Planctomycetaceae bacterium]MCB9940568.1 EF-P beta-lysylation protein EpmB [Planctomycetaceae bacterium]HRX81256.1 EF-P beta-lysylation protein EpmB [Pirellulaceae bacterium]